MPRSRADTHTLRGLLGVLAPAALLPFGRVRDAAALWEPTGPFALAVLIGHLLCAALLLTGATVLVSRPRLGRGLASAGITLMTALLLAGIPRSPALGLLLLLGAAALLAAIWPAESSAIAAPATDVAPRTRAETRGGAWAALLLWLLAVPGEWGGTPIRAAGAALALVLSTALALRWAWISRRLGAGSAPLVYAGAALTGIGGVVVPFAPLRGLLLMGVAPVLALLATRHTPPRDTHLTGFTPLEALLTHPARALVATFAALGLGGALVFSLPSAATRPVTFVDALFTAVSATCVTGLAVLDTPRDLTLFGQAALLGMIQVGGLGILTFSTATLALLGRRLSIRHEGAVADMIGDDRGGVFRAVRVVLAMTFQIEALGAAVLTAAFFTGGEELPAAAWRGLFTSVSAFCNAGFALQSDSLVAYQEQPLVLYTVGALITAGGLAPALLLGLPTLIRRGRAPLQHRLALVMSAVLLVGGALAIVVLEWDNALGALPMADRIHNAVFQSIALRTAGFNSVELSALAPATQTVMIAAMFVGGSPGSTAGGIKTTTAALLGLAVLASVRGQSEASAFGRRIHHDSVYRAAAIATIGLASAAAVLLALQLTQAMPLELLAFETVSALATVGLTIGATPRLDDVGKLIVAAAMFLGRIGPLTLFLLLTERAGRRDARLPEESVAVG